MNVLAQVVFLELQNRAGVKAAKSGVLVFKPGEKRGGGLAQSEKGFLDRLEAVADFLGGAVSGVFRGPSSA